VTTVRIGDLEIAWCPRSRTCIEAAGPIISIDKIYLSLASVRKGVDDRSWPLAEVEAFVRACRLLGHSGRAAPRSSRPRLASRGGSRVCGRWLPESAAAPVRRELVRESDARDRSRPAGWREPLGLARMAT
jgi:hypothetical protein